MKRRALFAAILGSAGLLGFCISGCERTQEDDGKIVIGLTVPSLTHPFFIFLRDNVMDEAQALGVEIVTADAEDVAAKQMSIVEDFIARRVDGVLVSPIGADSLVPAVEALNAAHIPVATVDRKVSGGQVLVHVGADNVEGGRVAARYIAERLGGQGKVIELEGTPGASPAIDRKKGFHEVIDPSGIECVASQTANFQRASGQSVMENLLQVHKDFQAVYAANDEMMLGALEAMESNKVDMSRVVTIGYDAIPDALSYIRAGRLSATVEQYPGRQARMALRLLVEHIRKGALPESNEVYIKPVVISAENLEQAEDKDVTRAE
ncbi:MAG: substrate-binding domain-containing protein [Pirellulaceae bacterium]